MTKPPRRYLKMISSNPDDWSNFWFDQIGWVGYFFAQLEWVTYWLADEVGSRAQQHEIKSRTFCARAKYANRHLVPKITDVKLRDDWTAFIKSIIKCSNMRNDILHNPLEINLDELQAGGVKINHGIRLMQKSGRKVVQLADVQDFTTGLRALNVTMLELMERTATQRKIQQ